MIEQPDFFDEMEETPAQRKKRTIQERFERFHREHPEVYKHLHRLALQWRSYGHDQCAIGMLWEVLRWQRTVEGLPDPDEDYKLNDHYRSRYARLLMEEEPLLADFFEVRELRSA
jgi:hypothetical protein